MPQPSPSATSALVQAHAATVLFGLAGLFGKWVVLPALEVAALRTVIASLCFAAVVWAWKRPVPSAAAAPHRALGPRRDWRSPLHATAPVVLAGAILGLHWWAFFHAIQVSTVAVALLAYSTAPGFVAVLEPLVHREAPSPRALAASAVVLAGVGLLVPHWSWSESTAQGCAWGVVAGLLFALLMLLNRHLVPRYGPVRLSFYLNLGASAVLVPLLPGVWAPPTARDWGLLLLLGVGFTVLAHTLFVGSLRRLRARTAAIVSALEPVYGTAGAALLLGEVPGGRTLLGGGLILGAVLWISAHAAREGGG